MSFYLFSDGIVDQLGQKKRVSFGNKRLKRVIEENVHLGFDEQKSRILDAFMKFKGDNEIQDDITVFGFRPSV